MVDDLLTAWPAAVTPAPVKPQSRECPHAQGEDDGRLASGRGARAAFQRPPHEPGRSLDASHQGEAVDGRLALEDRKGRLAEGDSLDRRALEEELHLGVALH